MFWSNTDAMMAFNSGTYTGASWVASETRKTVSSDGDGPRILSPCSLLNTMNDALRTSPNEGSSTDVLLNRSAGLYGPSRDAGLENPRGITAAYLLTHATLGRLGEQGETNGVIA